jgi:hypothetical protein
MIEGKSRIGGGGERRVKPSRSWRTNMPLIRSCVELLNQNHPIRIRTGKPNPANTGIIIVRSDLKRAALLILAGRDSLNVSSREIAKAGKTK